MASRFIYLLQGLDVLSACLPIEGKDKADWLLVCHRLWVARHDESLEVRELADALWDKIGMKVGAMESCVLIISEVCNYMTFSFHIFSLLSEFLFIGMVSMYSCFYIFVRIGHTRL